MRLALLTALLVTLAACGPTEETVTEEPFDNSSSLPIDLRAPREVEGTGDPVVEINEEDGPEMVLAVTPLLMNLMAKYELGARRTADETYRNALEERRAELRGVYNDFAELGRLYDFPVHSDIPDEVYSTTRRLEEAPNSEFATLFVPTVNREIVTARQLLGEYGDDVVLDDAFARARLRLLSALRTL